MSYPFTLDDDDQRELLVRARRSLRSFVTGVPDPLPRSQRPALRAAAAAFVTLHRKDGSLRGCIGQIHEDLPLDETVEAMAIAAGSRDPRFAPVGPDELDDLVFEISVLGDYQPVTRPSDVVIGTHGLTITRGTRRGLLLPQVATERNWSADMFLAQVCAKADLPADAWRRPDAQVMRFSAQVFGDPISHNA